MQQRLHVTSSWTREGGRQLLIMLRVVTTFLSFEFDGEKTKNKQTKHKQNLSQRLIGAAAVAAAAAAAYSAINRLD